MKEYIKVYKVNDFYELMNIIQGKEKNEDIRNDYIFRGVDNKDFDLIPSSLRKNSRINNYINKNFKFHKIYSLDDAVKEGIIKEKDSFDGKWIIPTVDKNGKVIDEKGYSIIRSDGELQFKRELYVLLKFLDYSDRNGKQNIGQDWNLWESYHLPNIMDYQQKYWIGHMIIKWDYILH